MQATEFPSIISQHKIFGAKRSRTAGTTQNTNRLAIRGTEVFYAVDNVVRCGNLNGNSNFKVCLTIRLKLVFICCTQNA